MYMHNSFFLKKEYVKITKNRSLVKKNIEDKNFY